MIVLDYYDVAFLLGALPKDEYPNLELTKERMSVFEKHCVVDVSTEPLECYNGHYTYFLHKESGRYIRIHWFEHSDWSISFELEPGDKMTKTKMFERKTKVIEQDYFEEVK